MRKFALSLSVCTAFLSVTFAHAQQVDLAFGASSTFASSYNNSSLTYLPAPEKGGIYPSFSADLIFKNHFGVNGEVAARAKQGNYNGYQGYRPFLYDFNGVFAPRVSAKATAELMAGVGGQSTIFYSPSAPCKYPGGCTTYLSHNHLLAHAGVGIRYYFWRSFFIRPEVHYYFVHNNFEFKSGNLFRAGASIGYTIGSK